MSTGEITTFDELQLALKKYMHKKEIAKINEAYLYAEKHHAKQYRKTGEGYIIHPLNVAYILTTIYADAESIMAALLHDTIEDTDATKEEIKELFGDTVAKLVDGVTKINSISVSTENDYLIEYYKKIIVGMSEDVRVIIIKLADRLHNMRTLYALPLEKQKKKAKETLEILAPIAHRLGIYKIKSELEDLSLRYLKPDAYFDIVERLNTTKLERESIVEEMMREVSKLLDANNIKYEIKGRAKSIYSIYKKLDKGRNFNDIYDILAIRILVEKEQECYWALGLIHSKYKPIPKRFKDYIAMPKTNLYQALHTTVFGLDGYLFEIQIRTYEMDEIAENGIASHWAYKENKNAAVMMQNITEQKLQFFKSIIELNEEKLSTEEFVTSVKDEVLNNNIYVFTPKGDVIELTRGSTPIDFAYKVHSEVGDHMTGAIVNNNIVPLSYELNDSDIVKIITNKNSSGPSREWLNIAKTTQAKGKIKAFFNRTNKDEYIVKGKNALEKELRKNKMSISDFMLNDNIKQVISKLKVEDVEDLYLNIGNGKYSPITVINSLKEGLTKENKDSVITKINKASDKDIIVSGIDNIQTRTANCCHPVPGDEIIGYITKTNGISIHRKTCHHLADDDERVVDVSWNDNTTSRYYSEIVIYTHDNIMLDIVQQSTSSHIIVDSLNTINRTDEIVYLITVLVFNKNDLEEYIKDLEKLKGVTKVERVFK
jgi:GTP pyrophosphokinase